MLYFKIYFAYILPRNSTCKQYAAADKPQTNEK